MTIPPYEARDERDRSRREKAIADFARRAVSTDPLELLCSDSPEIAFAPLRVLDLNALYL